MCVVSISEWMSAKDCCENSVTMNISSSQVRLTLEASCVAPRCCTRCLLDNGVSH